MLLVLLAFLLHSFAVLVKVPKLLSQTRSYGLGFRVYPTLEF